MSPSWSDSRPTPYSVWVPGHHKFQKPIEQSLLNQLIPYEGSRGTSYSLASPPVHTNSYINTGAHHSQSFTPSLEPNDSPPTQLLSQLYFWPLLMTHLLKTCMACEAVLIITDGAGTYSMNIKQN